MKNFFIVLILFIFSLFNNVLAAEYRVKPVHFDISNSIVFIPVKSVSQSNQSPVMNNLKYTRLEGINGIELELSSADMDIQPEDIVFSEGQLKEFKIEQSEKNVKMTLLFKDKYNPTNLKIRNVNNNIIVTVTTPPPYGMNYYINTYRQENSNPKDYMEELVVTSRTKDTQNIIPVNNDKGQVSEVNQAFVQNNNQKEESEEKYITKELSLGNTLRSKYFLNSAVVKDSLFKIAGGGTLSIQEPFTLENPARVVYDLPNTNINHSLHGHEIVLSNGDSLKVAQFNKNTARLVVTSKQAKQYIPVFSSDSQSLLITNPKNLMTNHLPDYKSNVVKFTYQEADKQKNFLFELDKPLVYSIKRNSDYIYIYFLNAEKYNDTNFHNVIKNTPYSDLSIHLLSTGMRIKLPLTTKANVNFYISPDGKVFKISSEVKTYVEEDKQQKEKEKEKKKKDLIKKEGSITTAPPVQTVRNKNVIVIDAGHGGKDCGAMRGNITEKAINLDVCMKLKTILQNKGYKVYMTRTDDTFISLEDRTIYTEGINPAVFVSVHVNSCNADTPKGIETHYYHDNSIELADCVHKKLTKKISYTPDRGLFKSRFYVINHTSVPAILVEIGFISNSEERQDMLTAKRQQATAEGIAEGIIEFIKTKL